MPTGEEGRLQAAVRRAPRSGAAHAALGRFYLERGQNFEAIWELGAAERLQPEERATSLQLAVALASGGLYHPAIRQLEALTARRPPSREGRVQLATLYIGTLQAQKALAALRAAPDLAEWAEGQLALGKAYEALGEAPPAAAAYQRAHRLAPRSSEPLLCLARLELSRGERAAARAALQQARGLDGPQAPVLTALAESYLPAPDASEDSGTGENPAGTELRKREMTRKRESDSERRGEGSEGRETGREEQGRDEQEPASPGRFGASHSSGFRSNTVSRFREFSRFRSSLPSSDLETAERWLTAAREADPAYVPALVALARVREQQQRRNDAYDLYTTALKITPGDTEANQGLADLLQSAGRTAEAHAARAHYFRAKGLPLRAIQEYEAMARFPAYQVPAVMEMGLILLETKQKERAVQVTQAALAQHPRDPALYERMVVLEMLWDHVQAQRWCEQWQRLEPRSLRPVWLLSRIVADQGDVARGIRLLEPVVRAEPENTDYTLTLAELLLRGRDPGQWARARQLLAAAAARPGADAKTDAELGQVLVLLHQPEAARQAYLRALDRDPDVSDPYANLVRLAPQVGQPDQADFWGPLVRAVEARLREESLLSRQTWEQPNDPAGHRDIGLHFLRNAALRKGESQLEEALRLRPGWPEAQEWLARVQRAREVL